MISYYAEMAPLLSSSAASNCFNYRIHIKRLFKVKVIPCHGMKYTTAFACHVTLADFLSKIIIERSVDFDVVASVTRIEQRAVSP